MKLMLTGARGLVGGAVLRRFHAAGWSIVAGCSGAARSADAAVTVVPFRLAEPAPQLEAAMVGCDLVIHCAALLPSGGSLDSEHGRRELYHRNAQGTFELMDMAARMKVPRFVFLSSANLFTSRPDVATEDTPVSPGDAYMLSKVAGELAADFFNRTSDTRYVSLRISAPYGAGFTAKAVIPIFVTRALAGEPLQVMGSGAREQVFTYVDDIARACMAAAESDAAGIYNIAGPAPVSMLELARATVAATGGRSDITFSGAPDPNESARRRIALERARRDLGWEPAFGIERGLEAMVAELRDPPRPLLVAA